MSPLVDKLYSLFIHKIKIVTNRSGYLEHDEAQGILKFQCKPWKKKSAQLEKCFSQTSFGFIPSSVYKMVDCIECY